MNRAKKQEVDSSQIKLPKDCDKPDKPDKPDKS